jgi:hypothetical protein
VKVQMRRSRVQKCKGGDRAAAGRPEVGARFIVPSYCGGRGEATPLP